MKKFFIGNSITNTFQKIKMSKILFPIEKAKIFKELLTGYSLAYSTSNVKHKLDF